jgi:hypothetical protein
VAEATPLANTPSLADTTPMPNPGADGDGESPSTDGDDPDASIAIPARPQQNPDAT